MRNLAKALLLVAVALGLALPNAMGRHHHDKCGGAEICDSQAAECSGIPPCDDCTPPPHCPCDEGPEDEHDSEQPTEPDNGDSPSTPHEHPHHHHHHHQCACSAGSGSLILENSDLLLLAPPYLGVPPIAEWSSPPESPVFLIERPPNA